MPETPRDKPSGTGHRAKEWLRNLGLVALLVAAWVLIPQLRAPTLPDQAPSLTMVALDGEQLDLTDFRGRKVILNFWATWCGPCKVEIPMLNRFAKQHPELEVLGVAIDGSAAELRAAVEDLEIGYPVVRTDAASLEAYQVKSVPLTVLVEADGTIGGAYAGVMLPPQLAWLAR